MIPSHDRIASRLSRLTCAGAVLLGCVCARYAHRDAAIVLPTPVNEVEPDYPEDARLRGAEGTAVVTIRVDRSGRVASAVLHSSSGETLLDEAALVAARQHTFTPARDRRDRPIGVTLRRPFRFRLGEFYGDDRPAPLTPRFMSAARMPEPIMVVEPVYPEVARAMGLTGEVRVALWLRKNGTVSVARIETSSGVPALDSAAVAAARATEFSPARDELGSPVNIWAIRTYKFPARKPS